MRRIEGPEADRSTATPGATTADQRQGTSWTSPIARRRRVVPVVLAATLTVLGLAAPSGAAPADEQPAGVGTYIVRADESGLPAAAAAVHGAGGRVTRTLPAIGTAVAELTPDQAASVRANAAVASVSADASLQLASTSYDATADVDSLHNITTLIGARDTWSHQTGRGVDVALIDSGVAPVAGLDRPGKVVHGPDLSFESQSEQLRHLDTFGHGTHLAGIIAGRDQVTGGSGSVTGDPLAYFGVAPGARIISLKVADAFGATDVSQVLAAIDWVVQHRRSGDLDIRVLNLSFSTRPGQPASLDPLSHAAEVAWRNGIVVVTSAGNEGTANGSLSNPAYNPALLAVGAVESNGTRDTADDVIPAWSSRGTGQRNPDLVAPGAHVQGLRVPGSFIDARHGSGSGSINERFLRGSGTSQAAAVVSGAVALLLEQRPSLTPDQVKSLLMGSARALPVADPQASGSGLLNIKRAMQTAAPRRAPTSTPSLGTGSLELARGGRNLTRGGAALTGEVDIFGKRYDAAHQAAAASTLTSWSGGDWNGSTWTGASWDGASWDGASWDGASWDGASWDGASWDGASWDGASWDGASWDGASWDGASWDAAGRNAADVSSMSGASLDGAASSSTDGSATTWSGASSSEQSWATAGWR